MGHNPSGYLAFGFYIGDEEDYDEAYKWLFKRNHGEEFETKVFEAFKKPDDLGHPLLEYPDLGQDWKGTRRDPEPMEAQVIKSYVVWWETQRRVLKDAGVELMYHGHENGSLSLVIAESQLSVEWGETADVTAHSKQFQDGSEIGWRAMITDFCERVGVQHQEPKWLLACSYG